MSQKQTATAAFVLVTAIAQAIIFGQATKSSTRPQIGTADVEWLRSGPVAVMRVPLPIQRFLEDRVEVDEAWKREINNHVVMMQTNEQLKLVATAKSLTATAWRKRFARPEDAIDWLRTHVEVRAIDGTSLISVRIDSESGHDESALLTNIFAKEYVQKCANSATADNQEQVRLLIQMKIRLQSTITEKKNALIAELARSGKAEPFDVSTLLLRDSIQTYRETLANMDAKLAKISAEDEIRLKSMPQLVLPAD